MHKTHQPPKRRMAFALTCLALIGLAIVEKDARAEDILTIGSAAPPLNIEHWVSDGNGRFEHIKEFEKGKVYVVEFWATWCRPCIASMPHMAKTQTKYADKGLQFISVSTEPLETVEQFVKRKVPNSKETYGELTSVYCLTTDPDNSVYEDYMQAAAQDGIPLSFLVGKDGAIEWIGDPLEIDAVIEKVLAGKWNRDAFAVEFKAEQESNIVMEKLYQKLDGLEDHAKALAIIDESINSTDNELAILQLSKLRLQVLAGTDATPKQISEYGKKLFGLAHSPTEINEIAWLVYEGVANSFMENDELIQVAIDQSVTAIEKASESFKPSMLDTIAHLYKVSRNLEKAIEYQEMAINTSKVDGEKKAMAVFLDSLKKEKKEKQSK